MRMAMIYGNNGFYQDFPSPDKHVNVPVYGTSNWVEIGTTRFPKADTETVFGSKVVKSGWACRLTFNVEGKIDNLELIAYAVGCAKGKGLPFTVKPHGGFTEIKTAFTGSLSSISKLLKRWHECGYTARTTRATFRRVDGMTHEHKVVDVSGNTSTTHELQEVRASLPPIAD